jgi:uncharacterized protein YjgD (DUF1641 family)
MSEELTQLNQKIDTLIVFMEEQQSRQRAMDELRDDQLEAIMGFTDEAQLLGKQVFNQMVEQLDELERKGYFSLANEGINVLDQVVEELNPEDVQALGTTMVASLKSLREPAPEKAPSMLALVREMNDPQVRIGLSKMVNVMKSLAN